MEIGQRLKQARLEKGLSQRQLCGDVITRNMLSQIENGSAKPSMDTLRYLAGQLGKPMGYFLEEDFSSEEDARQMEEALSLLAAAEQALLAGKPIYARELLEKAAAAGEKSAYYTPDNERRRLLLLGQVSPEQAAEIVVRLPDSEPERILRGRAALAAGDGEKCIRLLTCEGVCTPEGRLLLGDAYRIKGEFSLAAEQYQKAESAYPRQAAEKMEVCFRELGDYKMAYYYATKLRNQE